MIKLIKLLYLFFTAKYLKGEAFGNLLIQIYDLLIKDQIMIGSEGVLKLMRHIYKSNYIKIDLKEK